MYSCMNSQKYLEAEIVSHAKEIPSTYTKLEELSPEMQKLLKKRGKLLSEKLFHPEIEE